jgi:hypothetical protein
VSELRAAESPYARELTDLLQMLKSRADCSYEALARRSGVSGSALQRYCSGAGVPNDFDPIARFGKACGAGRWELLELHRLWVLVDAGRRRGAPRAAEPAPGAPSADEPTPPPMPVPVPVPESMPVPAPIPATEDTDSAEMPVKLLENATESAQAPYRPRLRHLRRWPVLVGALLVVGATVAGTVLHAGGHPAGADDSPNRPLLSAKCRFVAMGHQDTCVRDLQLLLKRAGLELEVDGAFGPFTQMRVVVFQLLAGLQTNGTVDDRTKRALYSGRVEAHPWSPARVERRVREVFTEDADRAGGIAKCASNLDPLYSLGNTNGTRNWGVFQLYDGTLRELGGTPRQALDPEWNIQAAHRLWARTHDFRAWPSCDKAYQAGASKSATPKGSKGKAEPSPTR